MEDYLLLFRNEPGQNGYITTEADMAEDMPRWQAWIGEAASQGRLISTHPIHYAATRVDNHGVHAGPDLSGNRVVAGYILLRAESEGAVVAWSKACPILKYPNGSVEIRKAIPFPQ